MAQNLIISLSNCKKGYCSAPDGTTAGAVCGKTIPATYVDLGYGDAGHVLHRILNGFLQGFGNLRDVGSVLEVDADVDDRYVVIEADLDGRALLPFFRKFLIGV